jgi:hypothetical protein
MATVQREQSLRARLKRLSAQHRSYRYRAFQRWLRTSPIAMMMSAAELKGEQQKLRERENLEYLKRKAEVLREWADGMHVAILTLTAVNDGRQTEHRASKTAGRDDEWVEVLHNIEVQMQRDLERVSEVRT